MTNGIGGFASGTIGGLATRRCHGLLIAALKPPLGRTLLVAKLEGTALYERQSFSLSTDRWADGTLSPQGYRHVERFRLDGTIESLKDQAVSSSRKVRIQSYPDA